jgi:hypothetical protein
MCATACSSSPSPHRLTQSHRHTEALAEVNTMAVVLAEVNGDSDFVTTSPVAVHPLNARRTTPDLPLRKRATKANRSPSLPVPLSLSFRGKTRSRKAETTHPVSQEPFCDTSKETKPPREWPPASDSNPPPARPPAQRQRFVVRLTFLCP